MSFIVCHPSPPSTRRICRHLLLLRHWSTPAVPARRLLLTSSASSRVVPDSSPTNSRGGAIVAAFSRYDDDSPDWRDWFDTAEYKNAWSQDVDNIEPLQCSSVLDSQSRGVLELMNRLFHVGLMNTVDRVTTDRIHILLQQLEDLPQQDRTSMWQRAERGRVLLEAMEQFEDYRHVPNLPLLLPLPTHETYWRVLRMYGNKFLSGMKQQQQNRTKRTVPEICHDIVQRMGDSGRLELQPTAVHWNQVLTAYANSSDERRPIHAATLLYDLDAKGLTDASSFAQALRACSATAARKQTATPYFVQIALPLARRIWAGLHKKSSTTTTTNSGLFLKPYHFTHMLRVFRHMPVESNERDESVAKVFQEAIEAQMVNIHVLNEFLEVASTKLQRSILGESNRAYLKDPQTLVRRIPVEWLEQQGGSNGKSPYVW